MGLGAQHDRWPVPRPNRAFLLVYIKQVAPVPSVASRMDQGLGQ